MTTKFAHKRTDVFPLRQQHYAAALFDASGNANGFVYLLVTQSGSIDAAFENLRAIIVNLKL